MLPFEFPGKARWWRGARLLIAPLLAIVMLTIGCGTQPRPAGQLGGSQVGRRLQSVSTYNVGVGLNTATNQFFMFSDLEAAKQLPEASSSYLVALEGYQLTGATSSISGRLDTQVVVPGSGQYSLSGAVDKFYYQDGDYDWYTELARQNRDVSGAMFDAIAATAGDLGVTQWSSPREAMSAATATGSMTVGSAWGDVRLMLAAMAVWARQQIPSSWNGGGGGQGQPDTNNLSPANPLAVEMEFCTGSIAVPTIQTAPSIATPSSVVVVFESAELATDSLTPFRVSIRSLYSNGAAIGGPIPLTNLRATDWRSFLTSPSAKLSETVLEQMSGAAHARLSSRPDASFMDLFEAARSGYPDEASLEIGAILVAEAVWTFSTAPAISQIQVDLPLEADEVRPQATIAVVHDLATGEDSPVTDPVLLSQFRTDPGKVVGSLETVGLTPDGYAKTMRLRVDRSGTTLAFRAVFPRPSQWVDPGPGFTISLAEWAYLRSNAGAEPPPYMVQFSTSLVLLGLTAAIILVILGGIGLSGLVDPLVRQTPGPSPDPSPSPTPVPPDSHKPHQLWVKLEVGSWNCVKNTTLGWHESYESIVIRDYLEPKLFALYVKSILGTRWPAYDGNILDYGIVNTLSPCPTPTP